MPAEDPKPAPLTVEEVAERLGVTARTVRNWINDGINGEKLPAVADGRGRKLAWPAALEFYVRMRIAKDGNGGNPPPPADAETFEQAETRKTIADADLKELKLAQLRGQLVPAAEVGKNIALVAQAIKMKLDSLPSDLCLQLTGKSDQLEVEQILRDAIYVVETELASVGTDVDLSLSDDDEDDE